MDTGGATDGRERVLGAELTAPALREHFGEPHIVEPTLRYAVWWTAPHGLIGAMLEPARIDERLHDYITGPLHAEMLERAQGEATYALHDWTLATGYDGTTRLRMVRWIVAHRAELAVVGVVQPPSASILRMAARVAEGLLAGSGVHFGLTDTAKEFIELHRLSRAER